MSFEFVKSVAADFLDAARVAAWQEWSAFVRCLDLNPTGNVSRHEVFFSNKLAGFGRCTNILYIGINLVDGRNPGKNGVLDSSGLWLEKV